MEKLDGEMSEVKHNDKRVKQKQKLGVLSESEHNNLIIDVMNLTLIRLSQEKGEKFF